MAEATDVLLSQTALQVIQYNGVSTTFFFFFSAATSIPWKYQLCEHGLFFVVRGAGSSFCLQAVKTHRQPAT